MSDFELNNRLDREQVARLDQSVTDDAVSAITRDDEAEPVFLAESQLGQNAADLRTNMIKRATRQQRLLGRLTLGRSKSRMEFHYNEPDPVGAINIALRTPLFGATQEDTVNGSTKFGWQLELNAPDPFEDGVIFGNPSPFEIAKYDSSVRVLRSATRNGLDVHDTWYHINPTAGPGRIVHSWHAANDTEKTILRSAAEKSHPEYEESRAFLGEFMLDSIVHNKVIDFKEFSTLTQKTSDARAVVDKLVPSAGPKAVLHCHFLIQLALRELKI